MRETVVVVKGMGGLRGEEGEDSGVRAPREKVENADGGDVDGPRRKGGVDDDGLQILSFSFPPSATLFFYLCQTFCHPGPVPRPRRCPRR